MLLNFNLFSKAFLTLALKEADFFRIVLWSLLRWHYNVPSVATLGMLKVPYGLTRIMAIIVKLLSFLLSIDLFDVTTSNMGRKWLPGRTAVPALTHAITFRIMWSVYALILVLGCRLTIILRVHSFANSSSLFHIGN